jgi:hypothetical protein
MLYFNAQYEIGLVSFLRRVAEDEQRSQRIPRELQRASQFDFSLRLCENSPSLR